MKSRALAGALVATFGLIVAVGVARAVQEAPFPHVRHQGLFPVCTGCHVGIPTGDDVTAFPSATLCAGCHDGLVRPRVAWSMPTDRPSNVTFDHERHAANLASAGDPVQSCESCHSDPLGGRMSVDGSEELSGCWACHAHERGDHFEIQLASATAASCESCHVPLAESGFGVDRIRRLPAPSDHAEPGFVLDGHGSDVEVDVSRCATCHTVERCVACHVNTGLDLIAAIPAAPADMEQPRWAHSYPRPPTHLEGSWSVNHYPFESSLAECATCHTQDDCTTCHVGSVPSDVRDLPAAAAVVAPGVRLEPGAPRTHQSLFFMSAHSNLAAAEPGTCATCHTESYCADCHDGPADGGYHPPSFVSRHAADAYGGTDECASCHSTAAFCRACHEEVGFESQGRLGAGFHDAEPLFLLRHGQAARQGLESCASCHQQSDCVQCHGVTGAFKVSPHTENFDARRAWAMSPRTCIACHISNPIGGGP